MSETPIIAEFVHIPKCGGWTTHQYFGDLFSLERTVDITDIKSPSEVSMDNIGMLLGHRYITTFKEFQKYHGYRSYRFTCVREPVARMWSYYRYLSRVEHLPTYEWVRKETFRQFCERIYAREKGKYGVHESSQATFITGADSPSNDQIVDAIHTDFDIVYQMSEISDALPMISRKIGAGHTDVKWLNADAIEGADAFSWSKELADGDAEFVLENSQADIFLCEYVAANSLLASA